MLRHSLHNFSSGLFSPSYKDLPSPPNCEPVVYEVEEPITVLFEQVWDCDNRFNNTQQTLNYTHEVKNTSTRERLSRRLEKHDQRLSALLKTNGGFHFGLAKIDVEQQFQADVSRYGEVLHELTTKESHESTETLSMGFVAGAGCRFRAYRVFLDTPSGILNTGSWVQKTGDETISPVDGKIKIRITRIVPSSPVPPRHDILDVSPEEMIEQCYRNFLGREVDPGGKAHRVQKLREGATPKEIARILLTSPEFHDKWKQRTAFDKVQFLYRILHNREPDPVGHQYWAERSNDWNDVVKRFLGSEEYNARDKCGDFMIWRPCPAPNSLRLRFRK